MSEQQFEKQNLTINVSPISLLLLMQTIVSNEEGILKYLEETIGLLPKGREEVKEVIRELYELSRRSLSLSF